VAEKTKKRQRLRVDWCRNGLLPDQMYPAAKWQLVGSTVGEPTEAMKEEARKAGATVIAYDGEGLWLFYKPRPTT